MTAAAGQGRCAAPGWTRCAEGTSERQPRQPRPLTWTGGACCVPVRRGRWRDTAAAEAPRTLHRSTSLDSQTGFCWQFTPCTSNIHSDWRQTRSGTMAAGEPSMRVHGAKAAKIAKVCGKEGVSDCLCSDAVQPRTLSACTGTKQKLVSERTCTLCCKCRDSVLVDGSCRTSARRLASAHAKMPRGTRAPPNSFEMSATVSRTDSKSRRKACVKTWAKALRHARTGALAATHAKPRA